MTNARKPATPTRNLEDLASDPLAARYVSIAVKALIPFGLLVGGAMHFAHATQAAAAHLLLALPQ